MEVEITNYKNIIIYPNHLEKVKRFSLFKGYKGESEAYQYIIDDFFNSDDKQVKYDFILFFLTPLLFVVLTTVVNLSTSRVYDTLLREGFFFDELFVLSRVFMIISFGSIGILIACVYWLRRKLIDRNNFKKGVNMDGDTSN